LLEPHYQKTADRLESVDAKYILSIQDGSVLNYSSHKAKTEIGRIGRTGKTDQYGLIQHSNLLITDQNEPLGLIDLQHFHYDDFDTTIQRHHRKIEEKQNICWINALKNMRGRLKNKNKKIITVADREGDFFEFLHELHTFQESFVIRAQHNRYIRDTHRDCDDKLFDLIKNENDIGEIAVTINDVSTHEIKDTELKIKRLKGVEIHPPYRAKSKYVENYKPIRVNVVMAYNETYCWILLTDLPVDNLEDCREVVIIYKSRWHIEDYHKILKTGYQIDELYLHSSRDAIENALTMASISACRLYWMIYVGRVETTIKADRLFEEYEWKALYVYFREKIPEESPSLAEVIIKIARLGGYKPRKNAKAPGIKTMWLGLQCFTIAAEMYKNFMSTKT
jgi:Transposase Tn5 dimerisation domain